ncbi:retrovirus-related pol polyprotein from transposon TNT 1-94 [Tanacetum coccineum]
MSTSKAYQQSLADADSETRPPMLERGSYIPWASRFRRYINRKRENQKWLNKALDEGPYQFQMFIPTGSTLPTLQTAEDLYGDEFVAEPGEVLVSVYNRFAQLMNDLERNRMIFPIVTVNTKFLSSLLLEWLKYVTQVRLAKHLTVDSFDDLFDYIQQFEKLQDDVQTNSEDPLTSAMLLLARAITQIFSNPTNNHLRTSSNTRNQAIIQGDRVDIQSRNPGNTSTVQCYNCIGKGHYARNSPKLRVRDSKYFMEQMLLAKQDEAGLLLSDEHNDFLFANASRMEEIEELSANMCLMARIQPADNTSDVGPRYDYAFISEVQSSSIKDNQEQMYPTHTKFINSTIGDDQIDSNIIFDEPNGNVNGGSVEKDTYVPDLYVLE